MKEKIIKSFPTTLDVLAIIGVLTIMSGMGKISLNFIETHFTQNAGMASFFVYVFNFLVSIFFALSLKKIRAKGVRVFNFSLRLVNPTIILWGLILTLAVSTLIEPLIGLFPQKHFDNLNNFIGSGGWGLITTIVAAPILEEVLFRGILQSSLSHNIGKWSALILVSLIFALVHGIPPQAVNAFFISMILGYLFIRTGSLLCVIIIHSLNNCLAYFTMMLGGGKYVSMRELIDNDKVFEIVYLASIFVFLIAVINVIMIFRRQKNNNKVK
ncbi:MAG: type II CAAX endopeptidase family protein [Rikenellaceae bacterium]